MGRLGIRPNSPRNIEQIKRPVYDPSTHPANVLTTTSRWPELRIVRRTNIDCPDGQQWDRFLNGFSQLNYGKGKGFALGAMAMSHVDAVEMGVMLDRKYPKVFTNRAKTIQLQRRIANNFNQFVRRQEHDANVAAYAAAESERIRLECGDDESFLKRLEEEADCQDGDAIYLESPKMPAIHWGIGNFAVRGLEKFSRNELGLDLTSNEQLYEEHQAVRSYLRDEGLDVSVIDPKKEPHLTMFETYGVLGAVTLDLDRLVRPDNIVLSPPAALTNTNN